MNSFNTIHLVGPLAEPPYLVWLGSGRKGVCCAIETSAVSRERDQLVRRRTRHVVLLPQQWMHTVKGWEAGQPVSVTGYLDTCRMKPEGNGRVAWKRTVVIRAESFRKEGPEMPKAPAV